ncbi:hypothetical protein HYQ19_gp074 [Arthrobacter phage DrYang]|uniref:Uncharacterized protein n=1 Tax=Arthrobacter phage DrYang TaxID=2686080 RepID=A0A6B9JC08_9CAUD|nr:hypothetical protein HYQ19_gp074 [Arthrobacter phage DrYang]QGZ17173.1 hypothetical protein SEA_DRYANG_74 [Arthrobacter phage DrYang]
MDKQHPDIPTTSPLQADAIGMFEVVKAMTAAGFTEDQAFRYIAIRGATLDKAPKCPHCGGDV